MAVSQTDRSWFAGEVERLLPALLGTALRLTRNRADAEDLVAEAVANAWIKLDSLHDRGALPGWLFRILTNEFLSSRRAAAVRGTAEPLDEDMVATNGFSLFERLHQPFLLWWGNPERAFLDKLLREAGDRRTPGSVPRRRRAGRRTGVLVSGGGRGVGHPDRDGALPVGTGTRRAAKGAVGTRARCGTDRRRGGRT